MNPNTKRKIEAARRAASALDDLGLSLEAESVRALCRANSMMSATLAAFWLDNQRLREIAGVEPLKIAN